MRNMNKYHNKVSYHKQICNVEVFNQQQIIKQTNLHLDTWNLILRYPRTLDRFNQEW